MVSPEKMTFEGHIAYLGFKHVAERDNGESSSAFPRAGEPTPKTYVHVSCPWDRILIDTNPNPCLVTKKIIIIISWPCDVLGCLE